MGNSSNLVILGVLFCLAIFSIGFWIFFVTEPAQEQYRLGIEARNKKDPQMCGRLTESLDRDICLREVGTSSLDLAVCGGISSESLKDDCVWLIADTSRDFDACERIKDESRKLSCMGSFGTIATCYATKDTAARDACYLRASKETNAPSICERIQGKETLSKCFLDVAVRMRNATVCIDSRVSGGDHDECLMQVGKALGNVTLCSFVTQKDSKDYCYLELATARNSKSSCDLISGQGFRDHCYRQIAPATRDPNICQLIGDPTQRDLCRTEVNQDAATATSTQKTPVQYTPPRPLIQ